MRCATGHAATEPGELSGLDARLLGLDPDLEELFAEIDQVLREARDRWRSPPPRGPRAPWPRQGARRREGGPPSCTDADRALGRLASAARPRR
ncbi:hypothetical protein OHA40_25110 [Nocardia sp. NBC_00508]|uniref:hypothetical protein n=1 Tax=Nocardia sp. NBC_00508 TaxID=2975992 RepID=UPI002E822437|nr:hypothetical protein [Nocardia sp. NBC_00508]WUD64929.1 hypothetical protein OHA40_25110 [Nocardia sp. NBC_00508]